MGKFHGYYIKCQSKDNTIAIIFGKTNDKAFIQIITEDETFNADFAKKDCKIAKRKFDFKVASNHVTEEGMTLDIKNKTLEVKGDIKFENFDKLVGEKKKWRKYAGESIMGPFQYLPFMECRHMIVSMQHRICGQITINNKTYDFQGGIGYIEGDRGTGFPRKYFWTQAHHDDISISASAAIIPYLGIRFKGTICVIKQGSREYRLATYRQAKVKQFTQNYLFIKQGKYKLIINVLDNKTSLPLFAPTKGQMNRVIHESVARTVHYKFTKGNQTLLDFTTDRAAIEFSDITKQGFLMVDKHQKMMVQKHLTVH